MKPLKGALLSITLRNTGLSRPFSLRQRAGSPSRLACVLQQPAKPPDQAICPNAPQAPDGVPILCPGTLAAAGSAWRSLQPWRVAIVSRDERNA